MINKGQYSPSFPNGESYIQDSIHHRFPDGGAYIQDSIHHRFPDGEDYIQDSIHNRSQTERAISRLGMSVTTQGGSGRQFVTGP